MSKEDSILSVVENQGTLGRLRFITKVRSAFICRECLNGFSKGSECFTQSDYRGQEFFPTQTRLCIDCGNIQIKNGIEIKNKELFERRKVEDNLEECIK